MKKYRITNKKIVLFILIITVLLEGCQDTNTGKICPIVVTGIYFINNDITRYTINDVVYYRDSSNKFKVGDTIKFSK